MTTHREYITPPAGAGVEVWAVKGADCRFFTTHAGEAEAVARAEELSRGSLRWSSSPRPGLHGVAVPYYVFRLPPGAAVEAGSLRRGGALHVVDASF